MLGGDPGLIQRQDFSDSKNAADPETYQSEKENAVVEKNHLSKRVCSPANWSYDEKQRHILYHATLLTKNISSNHFIISYHTQLTVE